MDRVDQLLDEPERQPEHDDILHAPHKLGDLSKSGVKQTGAEA